MNKLMVATVLGAFAGMSLMASAAQATGVEVTTINGAIYFDGNPNNYYEPANGFVPGGYANSSGIPITVPGTFGFEDGANLDTAAFTANSLSIEDVTFSSASNWTQIFTASTPGFFSGLVLTSDSFDPISWSLSGNTLTVQWGGTDTAGTGIADFSFGTTPLPSTWTMLIAGFLGLGFFAYRGTKKGSAAIAAA
jgi:hypothetical protein